MPAARQAAVTVGNRLAKSAIGARVEVDARVTGLAQPGVDGRRHDVARREIAHRVNARGDRIAVSRRRSTAPSPRSASVISGRRPPALPSNSMVGWNWMNSMSLTGTPGPQRQRDTVAGRTLGIGRRRVQVTEAAGGEDHRRGVHDAEAVVVEDQHTGDRAVVAQHLQRDVIAPDVQGGRGVVERALHLGARWRRRRRG